MTTRRGFFGMLAGLAATLALPKPVQSLEGKKIEVKAAGYTTYLMGEDAIIHFPDEVAYRVVFRSTPGTKMWTRIGTIPSHCGENLAFVDMEAE